MIEFEVRVLEINEIEFRKKLENLGAKFIGETLQRRYTPKDKITTLDVESIYNLYGININKIPILKFGD